MKKQVFTGLFLLFFIIFSCDNGPEANQDQKGDEVEERFAFFGDSITTNGAISTAELLEKYNSLNENDTLAVKFRGTIDKVCQTKGCWMSINLPEDQSATVRFKDYGFFMPLNAGESEAIVNGIAYLDVTSVEDLIAYAIENEATEDEIAEITTPDIRFAFEADGVLIKEE